MKKYMEPELEIYQMAFEAVATDEDDTEKDYSGGIEIG